MGFIDPLIIAQEKRELDKYLGTRNLTIEETKIILQNMIEYINAKVTSDMTKQLMKKEE